MLKTLLILCGVLIVSTTGLQAQGARGAAVAGRGAFVGHGGAFASSRPSFYRGANRGGSFHGDGRHHGGNRGRYYYLGGIPYFYPFGFGYPYYGSFYGDGFGYGYGYGYGGYPYSDGAYNGRYADNEAANNGSGDGTQPGGSSLPEAVQRLLAKRGYYKGSVDGQFGPASRSALSRFQRKQGLKETGQIDEATLQALGFTDRR